MLLNIHPDDPQPRLLSQVVEILSKDGVVVCPTDTVYALICSSERPKAIDKLCRLKGVKPNKANLSLICYDLSQLSLYTKQVHTPAFRMMKKVLPGPFTFILNASGEVPNIFKNKKRSVGIRIPDHNIPRVLSASLGHALVVTSVHDDDEIMEHTADATLIQERLGSSVDAVIDSGPGGLVGSTVVDLTGDDAVIIREGKGDPELLH